MNLDSHEVDTKLENVPSIPSIGRAFCVGYSDMGELKMFASGEGKSSSIGKTSSSGKGYPKVEIHRGGVRVISGGSIFDSDGVVFLEASVCSTLGSLFGRSGGSSSYSTCFCIFDVISMRSCHVSVIHTAGRRTYQCGETGDQPSNCPFCRHDLSIE